MVLGNFFKTVFFCQKTRPNNNHGLRPDSNNLVSLEITYMQAHYTSSLDFGQCTI